MIDSRMAAKDNISNAYGVSVLLAITLLFSACGGRPDRPSIRRIYYQGGHIKSEVTYIHDSVREGSATYYYDRDYNYSIYMEEYFKNGMLDSAFKEYYPNGLVKEQGMHNYGLPMGDFYFYYPNGKIKGYNAVDYYDKTFYAVFYDSSGHVSYKEGIAISKNIGNLNPKLVYHTNDTLHLIFTVAAPPHCSNVVETGLWKIDTVTNTAAAITPFEHRNPIRSVIDYRKIFAQRGSYLLLSRATLFDSSTNAVVTDSSVYQILIK